MLILNSYNSKTSCNYDKKKLHITYLFSFNILTHKIFTFKLPHLHFYICKLFQDPETNATY